MTERQSDALRAHVEADGPLQFKTPPFLLLKSYEACIRKFNKKSHRKYMLDDLDDQEIPYTCKTHTVFTSSSFNYRTSRKAEHVVLGILPKMLHLSHGVLSIQNNNDNYLVHKII